MPRLNSQKSTFLAPLSDALDDESYDWMNDNRPEIAGAIDLAIAEGVEPRVIRRFVMARTDRLELALRAEQYARAALRRLN